MMSFEDFCDAVAKDVVQYLPQQYQNAKTDLVKPEKVNIGMRTGVTFRIPQSTMAPVIYLNDYYAMMQNGKKTMGAVLDEIARAGADGIREMLSPSYEGLHPESLENWNLAKDKIYISAVGRMRNESLLQGIPHEDMGDFSCVYRLNPLDPSGEMGSVLISNGMLNAYGISQQELHERAVENTLRDNPPRLNKISDIMQYANAEAFGLDKDRQMMNLDRKNLLRDSFSAPQPAAFGVREDTQAEKNWWESDPEEERAGKADERTEDEDDNQDFDDEEVDREMDLPLYVLTNHSLARGSGVVFLPGVLEAIQKKMPEGFVVLPSSIHECMIISKNACGNVESLDTMVNEINATQVSPEEQLSDFAHVYDADLKRLICPAMPQLNIVKEVERSQNLAPDAVL